MVYISGAYALYGDLLEMMEYGIDIKKTELKMKKSVLGILFSPRTWPSGP